MRTAMTKRRGASLPEVLVAVVVLSIGLTSVVALFPVGISRIRNATLDTRTTIIAANAIDTFNIKRMANDPAITDWPVYDNLGAYELANGGASQGQLFDDPYRNPLAYVPYGPGAPGWGTGTLKPYDFWGANYGSTHPFVKTDTGRIRSTGALTDVSTTATDIPANSLYFISARNNQVYCPTAMPPNPLTVTDVNAGYDNSFPVLLDPWLFDQMSFQLGMMDQSTGLYPNGVPRIPIATAFLGASGAPIPGIVGYYGPNGLVDSSTGYAPYGDIAVLSLSEISMLPWPVATATSLDRETIKTRWFSSLADVQYSNERIGQITNPSASDYMAAGGTPLIVQNYYQPLGSVDNTKPLSTSNPIRATASRTYEYTWAAMFQRKLVPDPTNVGLTGRPNPADREFRGKVSIMCFYRRNLQQPFTIIEGCFYNGSRRATLSWPNGYSSAPTINVGTWLCEASVSRSTYSDAYLNGSFAAISGVYQTPTGPLDAVANPVTGKKRLYRRSYSFHQVTEVTDPVIIGSRVYVQVTLARPAIGYPLRYQNPVSLAIGALSGQDDRGIDNYLAVPTWPIFDVKGTAAASLTPSYDDETNCSQAQLNGLVPADYGNYSFYFPVIIFDGLREVFEYEQ